MPFHHVAIATNDLPRTHAFSTESMGFRLRKVEAAPAPEGLRAEMPELHDPPIREIFEAATASA